ncbi:MAG: hypothetical protein GY862_17995 [Gammaproteobacteria bacterium]|nr:hypothetical protein [Gammaproteobacteria bacterium]
MVKNFEKIWQDQIAAVAGIRARYGERAAFDYIIGEKLLTYAENAGNNPVFAQELPAFLASARKLFTSQYLNEELSRLERDLQKSNAELDQTFMEEADDWLVETQERATANRDRFAQISDLLLADQLGTS